MKTYWIDECIVTPEKLLPRGFELHIGGETARIVVPSDVPGDRECLLYEEEIPLSQKTFAATYENGVPVHIEDGETIGFEREISIVENALGERWEVRMTHNYMDARQLDENGNPLEYWKEISWSIFCENHRIDTDSF
jgi:hypothetical protein